MALLDMDISAVRKRIKKINGQTKGPSEKSYDIHEVSGCSSYSENQSATRLCKNNISGDDNFDHSLASTTCERNVETPSWRVPIRIPSKHQTILDGFDYSADVDTTETNSLLYLQRQRLGLKQRQHQQMLKLHSSCKDFDDLLPTGNSSSTMSQSSHTETFCASQTDITASSAFTYPISLLEESRRTNSRDSSKFDAASSEALTINYQQNCGNNQTGTPCLNKPAALLSNITHSRRLRVEGDTGLESARLTEEKSTKPTRKVGYAKPLEKQATENVTQVFVINGCRYQVLNLLGKGGTSKVYQVYCTSAASVSGTLAVKVVDLSDADTDTLHAYFNEIELLKRLQPFSSRIVRMIDFEHLVEEKLLYVVMEKGDTDLASFFKSRRTDLTPELILFYWKEMLECVNMIHRNGIVHSDLKPSNFLLVAGNLKLIDFGIANAVPENKTSVTKDTQMGTLNYMSPEAIRTAQESTDGELKYKVGTKSDVWSLGCILYYMVYGRTPFQHITNTYTKLFAITNEQLTIKFPNCHDDLERVDVMKSCLQRDPKKRPSVDDLLVHPYLTKNKKCLSNGDFGAMSSVASHIPVHVIQEIIGQHTPTTSVRLLKSITDAHSK